MVVVLSRAVADHMASYAALSSLGSVSTVAARVQSRADARPPPPPASTGGGEGAGGGLAAVDETTLMFSVLIVTGGVIVLVATAALGYRYVWLRLAPSRGSTRLAGLPHPWGAARHREAAPLTYSRLVAASSFLSRCGLSSQNWRRNGWMALSVDNRREHTPIGPCVVCY